jgi:AcrR family transcriptional regulator
MPTPTAAEIAPELADKRLHILRSAIRALAGRGYEGIRLRDIARSADVSVGVLQHYFETREQLLSEAFEQASLDLLSRWETAAQLDLDPWQTIVALVDELALDPKVREHCIVWTEFCASATRHTNLYAPLTRIYASWRQLFATAITEGIQEGLFRPAPGLTVDDILDLLLTHIDGCEMAIAAGVGIVDGTRMRELVLRTAALLLGVAEDRRP